MILRYDSRSTITAVCTACSVSSLSYNPFVQTVPAFIRAASRVEWKTISRYSDAELLTDFSMELPTFCKSVALGIVIEKLGKPRAFCRRLLSRYCRLEDRNAHDLKRQITLSLLRLRDR